MKACTDLLQIRLVLPRILCELKFFFYLFCLFIRSLQGGSFPSAKELPSLSKVKKEIWVLLYSLMQAASGVSEIKLKKQKERNKNK